MSYIYYFESMQLAIFFIGTIYFSRVKTSHRKTDLELDLVILVLADPLTMSHLTQ